MAASQSAVATGRARPAAPSPDGAPGAASGNGDRLSHGLGWASAGLGLVLLAAPRWVGRAIGAEDTPGPRAAAAVVGTRELAAAAGLLRSSPKWLWARVAGDVMDLGLLGVVALRDHDGRAQRRTMAATAAVLGLTGLDVYAAATRSPMASVMDINGAVTVTCSARDAYEQWRRLENLPSFLAHLDDVQVTGPATSHWRASAPFGRTVEWDAEITADVPGERIAWRSTGEAAVPNEGEVRFTPAPGGRGTEVRASLSYLMPGGRIGAAAARYFGEEPHQQLDDDLRRFKQITETGEVVRSDGAPGGKRARGEFPQRPARPLSAIELKELWS